MKQNKPIMLSEKVWAKLYLKLFEDNHSSVMLIREKMKVVLGFTVRRHRDWILNELNNRREPVEYICLDFYDESKRTMFLLRYGDFLNDH